MSAGGICPICEMPLAGSPQTDFGGRPVHTTCLREAQDEMDSFLMYDKRNSPNEENDK